MCLILWLQLPRFDVQTYFWIVLVRSASLCESWQGHLPCFQAHGREFDAGQLFLLLEVFVETVDWRYLDEVVVQLDDGCIKQDGAVAGVEEHTEGERRN